MGRRTKYGTPRCIRDLLTVAEREGWEVELRRSGHWRLRGPHGETIWAPQTPRGERAAANLRAALRRSGVEVP